MMKGEGEGWRGEVGTAKVLHVSVCVCVCVRTRTLARATQAHACHHPAVCAAVFAARAPAGDDR